jgi:hypothetical protein
LTFVKQAYRPTLLLAAALTIPGVCPAGIVSMLTATPGGSYAFGIEQIPLFNDVLTSVTTSMVPAIDAGASSNDGCEPISNNVLGAVALVQQGNCLFSIKAVNAANAGAVGLIIYANTSNPLPAPGFLGPAPVFIGGLMVTQSVGTAFLAALSSGPVTVSFSLEPEPVPEPASVGLGALAIVTSYIARRGRG